MGILENELIYKEAIKTLNNNNILAIAVELREVYIVKM